MREISRELLRLLEQYEGDENKLLQDYPKLEYLYALAQLRENLLEWYPFRKDGVLLQVGSDCGALTGLYSRKTGRVTVTDENRDNLELNRRRHRDVSNVTYVNGTMDELEGQKFDYIMMIGSLRADDGQMVAQAKTLLVPGGELIVAAPNRFGMKYWAGVKREENCFSRHELERLLTGETDPEQGESGQLFCYYPMPDYRLPVTVYSASYLPRKGDLTNVQTVYDYPRYLLMDVGAAFDAVCEDGQFENFANSFLFVWRNRDGNEYGGN